MSKEKREITIMGSEKTADLSIGTLKGVVTKAVNTQLKKWNLERSYTTRPPVYMALMDVGQRGGSRRRIKEGGGLTRQQLRDAGLRSVPHIGEECIQTWGKKT